MPAFSAHPQPGAGVPDGAPAAAVAIRPAVAPADVRAVRALFEEYQRAIGVDLCFQNFAAELAGLPGAYAPPRGRLFLAGSPESAIGCVALRPLEVADAAPGTVGEVKRLYVRPSARGTGAGVALVQAVIDAARAIGYRELRLDTLTDMTAARALYERFGFRTIPPYYDNPLPGTCYLALTLAPPG